MTDLPPLGLDVAKSKFNACLIRESGKLRHSSFANSPAGFAQLSQWLAKLGASIRAQHYGRRAGAVKVVVRSRSPSSVF